MQKSEILEEKQKVKSKSNTPNKNSNNKNLKSPIRVIKKENSENLNDLNKSRSYKYLSKDNFCENNKTNYNTNINNKQNILEEENSINNLSVKINKNNNNLNDNIKENNLNSGSSENINKIKIISETMIEKNIIYKEKTKRNNLGNFYNLQNINYINENDIIEKNKFMDNHQLNLKIELNKDESIPENIFSALNLNVNKNSNIKDLKIESNKIIIPPNNINEMIKKEKIKNEDINLKFEENNSNIDDMEYIKISNSKKKKEWRSWSLSEKELFYEAIANGANYTSLQKLFKNMNDVMIFLFFFYQIIID